MVGWWSSGFCGLQCVMPRERNVNIGSYTTESVLKLRYVWMEKNGMKRMRKSVEHLCLRELHCLSKTNKPKSFSYPQSKHCLQHKYTFKKVGRFYDHGTGADLWLMYLPTVQAVLTLHVSGGNDGLEGRMVFWFILAIESIPLTPYTTMNSRNSYPCVKKKLVVIYSYGGYSSTKTICNAKFPVLLCKPNLLSPVWWVSI